MKTEPSPTTTPSGLTRRSFIKRSVVAAVAASSLTIMSGLVNANTEGPYAPLHITSCWIKHAPGEDGRCVLTPFLTPFGVVTMNICKAECFPKLSTPNGNGHPRKDLFEVSCDDDDNIVPDPSLYANAAGCLTPEDQLT